MSIGHAGYRRGAPPAIHHPRSPDCCADRALRRSAPPPLKPVSNRGFTLVELLVAVIVLAVGLLGLARLQLSALKSNDSARLRTIATDASYDVVERIRANPGAILAQADLTAQTPLVKAEDCPASVCNTPATCLKKSFCARGLPESTLDADCSTATSKCGTGNCAIIVSWNDARGDTKDLTKDLKEAHRPAFRTCIRLPLPPL